MLFLLFQAGDFMNDRPMTNQHTSHWFILPFVLFWGYWIVRWVIGKNNERKYWKDINRRLDENELKRKGD